jgi:hypothetical protein
MSLYGASYVFVHEVSVHRRLPIASRRGRYLQWLRDAHSMHHRFGGEPYGMLFPMMQRSLRARAQHDDSSVDRSTARSCNSASGRECDASPSK